MEFKTSKEVRKIWLDFFESKNHMIIESKSLIPKNDPSLLWINSGVATLKDFFSGKKIPPSPRMANSQNAIRTNDIENVGITARHHTFFEMLGNFSIGDYFKDDAINFAYELLFSVFKFDKKNIYITYFNEDEDTYKKWISLGIDKEHLISNGKEENFWDVGQGPCGPDTEIFYDRGGKYDPKNEGLNLLINDLENDRYIEIWNIVFSQFNNDGENNYVELQQKNIDTGAGLERIVSIFQNAPTNFDTDLFLPIIKEIEIESGKFYKVDNYFIKNPRQSEINKHFKIIADHLRASVIAINDGEKPSNVSRGYIIRRLIRRAYRSCIQLGIAKKTFLHELVDVVANILDHYTFDIENIKSIIKKEEQLFSKTIDQGESLLEAELSNNNTLDFKTVFKLYETYGFPIELTQEILKNKGIEVDISQMDHFKKQHADASRIKLKNAMNKQIQVIQSVETLKSSFVGYEKLSVATESIFVGEEGAKYYVLAKETPLYPTSGGQRFDAGHINDVPIIDVFYDKYKNIWHVLKQNIKDKELKIEVDNDWRKKSSINHSATHLLFKVLREMFPTQNIIQLGSYNDANKLRFDFALDHKLSKEEISILEKNISLYIKNPKQTKICIVDSIDRVKDAIYMDGEEYGKNIRIVDLGWTKDLCGGTHITSTSEIEDFKIISVDSKGSSVFRIEAITTTKVVKKFNKNIFDKLEIELNNQIIKNIKIDSEYVLNNTSKTIKELEQLIIIAKLDYKKLLKINTNKNIDIEIPPTLYNGMEALIKLDFENPSIIKNVALKLREQKPDAIIIIGSPQNKKRSLLVVASNNFDSNDMIQKIFQNHNGKGGGNKLFAMGSCDFLSIEDIK